MDFLAPVLFFILLACLMAAAVKLRGKQQPQEEERLTPKQQARKKESELEEIVRVERLRHQFRQRHENPPKPETYGD